MARWLKTLRSRVQFPVSAHIGWLTVALIPAPEDSVLSSNLCRHAHHMWYTFTQTHIHREVCLEIAFEGWGDLVLACKYKELSLVLWHL